MALSPKQIQQLIDRATDNPQSLVEWLGNGGLKELLTAMNDNAVLRGIMQFADTTSMSLAGGTDSEFAVCKNSNGYLSIYQYFPNIDSTVSSAITSLVGGQWRPIYAANDTTKYITSLSLTVTSGDTGADIPIPFAFPSSGYAVLIEPTNLYAATTLKNIGWYVTGKTTTQFRIAYASAIVTGGTLEANVLVII